MDYDRFKKLKRRYYDASSTYYNYMPEGWRKLPESFIKDPEKSVRWNREYVVENTEISSGGIATIAQGIVAIATFGLIYLAAECITILRRVLLDCVIATHEAEVRETSVEKR